MNSSHPQYCDDLSLDNDVSLSNDAVPFGPAVYVDCQEPTEHPLGSLGSSESGSSTAITQRKRVWKLTSKSNRKGATTVEMAVVLPVFLIFIFGIIQYGHLMWVSNMLRNSVREAARYGSTEGITSEEVIADIRNSMKSIVDVERLSIVVKDASHLDEAADEEAGQQNIEDLQGAELFTMEPRQLFVVRASIDVNDVALVQLPAIDGFDLFGQTFMRHE